MFANSLNTLKRDVKMLAKQGVSSDVLSLVDKQITKAKWFREQSKRKEHTDQRAQTYRLAILEISFAHTLVSHIRETYINKKGVA